MKEAGLKHIVQVQKNDINRIKMVQEPVKYETDEVKPTSTDEQNKSG